MGLNKISDEKKMEKGSDGQVVEYFCACDRCPMGLKRFMQFL